MTTISQTPAVLTDVMANTNGLTVEQGQEPPSGLRGKGTTDSPYDQGNAPEVAAGPGIEPPSGQQGKGTVDSAYDQGNEPENEENKTTTTPANPTVETLKASNEKDGSVPVMPSSPDDPLGSPSTTHQGSGNPLSEPTKEQEKVISEQRGRDETSQRTTSTMLEVPGATKSSGTAGQGGNFDASKPGAGSEASRLRQFERSVSPGQLDDGTHVRCSGDRGQTYSPGGNKVNKLKEKFHIGKRH